MSAEKTLAWVGLGSNLGERRAQLDGAIDALRAAEGIEVLRVSSWIETKPVGGPPDQPDYLNGVCEIESKVPAEDLLWLLQAIEAQFERVRRGVPQNAPRTLDCDLLFFGDEEFDLPDLIVPHPRLEDRLFVLEPLNELEPDLHLSRSGKTVRERVEELHLMEKHGAEA
jgi:2-amino-4-hydroxy-6-hydroxymethyldihydropteridine diphosphokinase